MKKYLLFFMASMLSIVACAADGDTFAYEGLNFKVISEKDHFVAVAINEGAAGDISIPSYAVNGSLRYIVTEIGGHAFGACFDLTSVSIPNSVTAIGTNAFYACSKLTSITIPNSVTAIGTDAFASCSKLTSITIPNSVTTIGEGGIGHCSNMTEITVENGNPNYSSENGVLFNVDKTTLIQYPAGKKGAYSIPNSVTAIGTKAFYFGKLTSVTIPNSVTAIEKQAFLYCDIASITIPNSVTTIGERALGNCASMTEIIVEDGNPNYSSENGVLFNVDKTTLIQCPGGKTEKYSIPNSVTAIEAYAFDYCRKLTSVTIPNSVTTIGKYAFDSCSQLTSVTIPDAVTAIESSTFSYCRSLTSVTIPASVTEIKYDAFNGCSSLKTIYDLNPIPQTIGQWAFSGVPEDAVVYIPVGSFNKYFVAEGWTHFTDFREMGAGVDDVLTDVDSPVDVFNLNGVVLLRNAAATELENLPAGIYIVRQGTSVKKIAVK